MTNHVLAPHVCVVYEWTNLQYVLHGLCVVCTRLFLCMCRSVVGLQLFVQATECGEEVNPAQRHQYMRFFITDDKVSNHTVCLLMMAR